MPILIITCLLNLILIIILDMISTLIMISMKAHWIQGLSLLYIVILEVYIQGNFDNLAHILSELQFSFSVIGLSETKFMTNKDILTNLDLPGYDFISQPSLSNAGGVGFYVKNNLTYSILSNFTTTESDF